MNEFKTWEQLSEKERLLCMISDDYKTLMGFRPRGIREDITVEELRSWHAEICADLRREMEYERAEELAHEQAVVKAMTPKVWTIGELVNL